MTIPTGKTMGDVYPHLLRHPKHADLAASPFPPEPERIGRFRPSTVPDGGKLRVGLWGPVLFEGGAEAWMLALARALARVVSWRGLAVSEGRAAVASGMPERFAGLMPVGYGRDACRLLAADCDVVITWAIANIPALLTGLPCPPRIVNVCHSPIESEWGRQVYRDPSGITSFVAVSELAVAPIHPDHQAGVIVIWNAVDERRLEVTRDRATMRRRWGVPDRAPVVGYLGRLSSEKDPLAMARLVAALPEEWHGVVVGDGNQRSPLEALRSELGLTDRLHLVGRDNAAGDVLGGFDTLIVPSEYESFGLSLAEGLWAGVPVVSTPVGLARLVPGLTRLVTVGASGRELAGAVLADAADPSATGDRVDRARAFARERISMDRFGREWAEFLRSLGPRPRIKAQAAVLKRVRECPHRVAPACGCPQVPATCQRPDRAGLPVWQPDCVACRTEAA